MSDSDLAVEERSPVSPSAQRVAIGGWLLLFVLQGVAISGRGIWVITRDAYRMLLFEHAVKPSSHALTGLVAGRLAASWVVFLLYVIGLALIATRSPATRRYWGVALLGVAAALLAQAGIGVAEHSHFVAHPPAVQAQTPAASASATTLSWPWNLVRALLGAMIPIVWWLYWRTSERVRRTFATRDAAK